MPTSRRRRKLAARCTTKKACAKGEEATSCQTNQRGPATCKKDLAKDGWTFNCKVRNPDGWNEIWCRAKPDAPK
ncbi:MAG: hypothetical protein QM765_36560 [Myxococcales bacterium]